MKFLISSSRGWNKAGRRWAAALISSSVLGLCFTSASFAQPQGLSRPAGFLRLEVAGDSFEMAGMPFEPFSASVQEVLWGQLVGSDDEETADTIYKWNPVRQEYDIAVKAEGTAVPGWDGNWVSQNGMSWDISGMTIEVGDGLILRNNQSFPQVVFLAGHVTMDAMHVRDLYPGLNMFSYPFVGSIDLGSTSLEEDGAWAGFTWRKADWVLNPWRNGGCWLKKRKGWRSADGGLPGSALESGAGYWYARNAGDSMRWEEERPYPDIFEGPEGFPRIVDIRRDDDHGSVLVTMDASEEGGGRIRMYSRDIGPGEVFDSATGWTALEDIDVGDAIRIVWRDTRDVRASLANARIRLYMAARLDVDTDSDSLSDVEELLEIGTDPENQDTDGDMMPDGWEVANGLDPLADDSSGDKDEDGITNIEEYRNIAPPQPRVPYLGMSLPATYRAFSETSPWNVPIASDAPVDEDSDLMIAKLSESVSQLQFSATKWTIPVHVIDSRCCPLIDIPTTSDALYYTVDPDDNMIAEGMPMPEEAWSDPERDGHMVLIDPRAGKSWDFSRARKQEDGSWVASRMDVWDLNGEGFREAFSGPHWWTSGAMASGLPLFGGLIRPEEIEAGLIRHALIFASPVGRYSSTPDGPLEVCVPASRSDGQGIGPEYIPLGARLRLDPDLDLDSLDLTPATRVIAEAMQKYGMYHAMSGPTFKVYFQNLGPDGGAWRDYSYNFENIPVGSFRVIECDIRTH